MERGPDDAELQSVRFVGPATAAALAGQGYDTTAITDKRVSYRLLIEAGVNPGVAAKIRREHSLSWSFDSGGDLDRRSAQVRGLGSAEAEWVAASAGDWEDESTVGGVDSSDAAAGDSAETDATDETDAADETDATDDVWSNDPTPWPTYGGSADAATDGSGDAISAEAAWRARSAPTPVTDLQVVDETAADKLAEAGITSVRSLATADAEHVADVLELSETVVNEWYQSAREKFEQS